MRDRSVLQFEMMHLESVSLDLREHLFLRVSFEPPVTLGVSHISTAKLFLSQGSSSSAGVMANALPAQRANALSCSRTNRVQTRLPVRLGRLTCCSPMQDGPERPVLGTWCGRYRSPATPRCMCCVKVVAQTRARRSPGHSLQTRSKVGRVGVLSKMQVEQRTARASPRASPRATLCCGAALGLQVGWQGRPVSGTWFGV